MKVRSTVSADISMHVIWVNSTDFDSTVRPSRFMKFW